MVSSLAGGAKDRSKRGPGCSICSGGCDLTGDPVGALPGDPAQQLDAVEVVPIGNVLIEEALEKGVDPGVCWCVHIVKFS